MEDQRVMVIQDASKQVCSSAIRWAFHTLFLKPGDLLLLLGVLHQVNHPTPVVSLKGTRKPGKISSFWNYLQFCLIHFLQIKFVCFEVGYRKKMGFSSKFAVNHTIVDRETTKEEFENNAEILEISKLCKAQKVSQTFKPLYTYIYISNESSPLVNSGWV